MHKPERISTCFVRVDLGVYTGRPVYMPIQERPLGSPQRTVPVFIPCILVHDSRAGQVTHIDTCAGIIHIRYDYRLLVPLDRVLTIGYVQRTYYSLPQFSKTQITIVIIAVIPSCSRGQEIMAVNHIGQGREYHVA